MVRRGALSGTTAGAELEREFDADAGAPLVLSAKEVKEADSECRVTRICMQGSGTAAQWGGLARSAIDILLRAVKLRCGGPRVGAQALAIGTGVDEEACVAAAGPRATAGAAAVAVPFGKAWATEYLKGVDGAAEPVIQEADAQRARESASANVRIPRGSSDQKSTVPSYADGTSFPEGSYASGGVVWSQTRRVAQGL
jgi:hypothetical protein